MKKPNYTILKDKTIAVKALAGGKVQERLVGWNYTQLVAAFGQPTFTELHSGGKVRKEWVIQDNSTGEVFSIYDWKTESEDYTKVWLQEWNVGGKTKTSKFVTDIIIQLKQKN